MSEDSEMWAEHKKERQDELKKMSLKSLLREKYSLELCIDHYQNELDMVMEEYYRRMDEHFKKK